MRRISLIAVSVLLLAAAPAGASRVAISRAQVRQAARAYAATEGGSAHLTCHRHACRVSQLIGSGSWASWTLHYTVSVTRRGRWLIATSPLFAGSVRITARR